jgi:hypothetical protein
LPDGKPPVYTWTVTTGNGESSFTVEACASRIEATGHMVLYGPDREPVFTAEPGQRCTFQRRARAEAPAAEPEGPPADHWTSETVERVTHTATGKSAEAPTRDEATGKLVRRLVEDGDISINAARRVHGLKPFDFPEADVPRAGLVAKASEAAGRAAGCCGEGVACPSCA